MKNLPNIKQLLLTVISEDQIADLNTGQIYHYLESVLGLDIEFGDSLKDIEEKLATIALALHFDPANMAAAYNIIGSDPIIALKNREGNKVKLVASDLVELVTIGGLDYYVFEE